MDYYQNQQQPGYIDPGQQQQDPAANIQPPEFNPMWNNMNPAQTLQNHALQQNSRKKSKKSIIFC